MIRARTGRSVPRPILLVSLLFAVAVVAGCNASTSPSAIGSIGTSPGPSASNAESPLSSSRATPAVSNAPSESADQSTPDPSGSSAACSGSDGNRAFFAKAATVMSWSVYCAVLPDGWFLEDGSYRLANGGLLEVSYRGPGDVHIAIGEGNVCDQAGSDVDTCAPRDTVIGAAAMGDQTGELGQLSNGLVLDVDRGANPSWRVTGLGLSEADFREICAAMLLVVPAP